MKQKSLPITIIFVLSTMIFASLFLPSRAAQPAQARAGESPS